MPRRKTIRTSDFLPVFAEEWRPVILEGDAMPPFARSVPEALLCCTIASGQDSIATPSRLVRSGYRVGGVEIYRHSPDDPVPLNMDRYTIVTTGDPETLAVDGPFKDGEHWVTEIPARYQGIKVIGSRDDTGSE